MRIDIGIQIEYELGKKKEVAREREVEGEERKRMRVPHEEGVDL